MQVIGLLPRGLIIQRIQSRLRFIDRGHRLFWSDVRIFQFAPRVVQRIHSQFLLRVGQRGLLDGLFRLFKLLHLLRNGAAQFLALRQNLLLRIWQGECGNQRDQEEE